MKLKIEVDLDNREVFNADDLARRLHEAAFMPLIAGQIMERVDKEKQVYLRAEVRP